MSKTIHIALFLLLCSCSVGNNEEIPVFISDENVGKTLNLEKTAKKINKNWFEIFNDKDLNTLLNQLWKSNFSIAIGKERLQQARYNLYIYSKQNYPFIDSDNSYNFNKNNNINDISSDINTFKLGFDMSWELDIWGKGKYISDQYYELMKGAKYSLENIKSSIVAEMTMNYINLRKLQKKMQIAQKNIKLQQDILEIVKSKYQTGTTDKLALEQALFTLEKTKSTIPLLNTQIENYKNSIAVLLGVLPQDLPINLEECKKNITSTPFKYSVKKLYNLPLNIIRTRPDIMTSEQKIITQNMVVNQAIADLYPSFNIGATFGFISSSGNTLIKTNNQTYGYTPSINIPIWHWGQLTNNIELQKHIKEEFILNYNEALLTALMEVKNAITSIEQSYKTNSSLSSSLHNIKNIMQLTKDKYQNGLIEFTDVALAEQNYLEAENNFIDSNAEILQNITAFYKATGGGYNIN